MLNIGKNFLFKPSSWCSLISGTQIFIVTDQQVAPYYLNPLLDTLKNYQTNTFILEPGETQKSLYYFEKIIHDLCQHQHHRDTTLIALGGGVVTDLAGFVAACYHRGVAYIAVPTSLIAQIDAAIGGKTAVNYLDRKNIMGAFYPPKAVLIDINTLQTLPEREFCSGLAEIIKAALICNAPFFEWLEQHIQKLLSREEDVLQYAIQQACDIKSNIVMQDEKEKRDIRILLNLGHTFAHAIETKVGLGVWLHGEAVAVGIMIAVHISGMMGWLSQVDQHRILQLLKQADLLKKKPKNISFSDLTHAMQSDKKIKNNRLRLILLSAIGKAVVCDDVSMDMIQQAWEQMAQ